MEPSARAGDIFLTRSNSKFSPVIQGLTASDWSHVAIAIGDDLILEAVRDSQPQVRVLPLHQFAASAVAVRKYSHPGLTDQQALQLAAFAKSVCRQRYTLVHAVLTGTIPLLRIFFLGVAVLSWVDIGRDALATHSNGASAAWASLFVAGLVYVSYRLMVWSIQTNVGVKSMEAIFQRHRLGKRLVEIKHDLFCSKLVLLADKALHGPLSGLVPGESEIWPKHIAMACEKLGWRQVDVVGPGAADDGAAR